MKAIVLTALAASVAGIATPAAAQLLPAPPAERCVGAPRTPGRAAEWLARARESVLPSAWQGRLLRYRASHDVPMWEQSDRPYEPYVPNTVLQDRWYQPATGVEGRQPVERALRAGAPPSQLSSATAAFVARDTILTPTPGAMQGASASRRLNPWAILDDWQNAVSDVSVVDRCMDREQWRIVLGRLGERLYLAESDGTPTKLVREEPHYLFGQVRVEYQWATWWGVRGGGLFPLVSARLFDGTLYERVGVRQGSAVLVPPDSAPPLAIPTVEPMRASFAFPSFPLDTTRVADGVYLLVTRAYTHAVTAVRDTVYLLDATSSEERSRQDSAMIAALFPSHRAVVLVVTDLAWPHISGVRFWVARGATVVSHPASKDMLTRVVERKWQTPDALENTRPRARLRFVPVTDSLRLAGGELVVHALRGALTENALGVWMPAQRFFWAGDYYQGGGTSPYARDVVRTICALRIKPALVAAQHVRATPWDSVAIGPATRPAGCD